ncbi:hypothetical protein GDO78_015675 [Eleutherodactylus coqui]|uniref:Uncharacterized protein n=1 Tax=Eleutherodactylus coqui TaxID=57060 RepID=A0A8J6B5K7_ELECQ|nr:hypothetical protein GDO78_015675 [Eleutherodactylus coqui]
MNEQNDLMRRVLTTCVRNKMIKTAPPAYKEVNMPVLINQTGHPVAEVLKAVRQLGDLGDFGPVFNEDGSQQDQNPNCTRRTKVNQSGVNRRDMFIALLKAGVPWEKIDEIHTDEM